MFDLKRVGEQIALLRKERGLTQDALAESLNVSAQAVSKWENGHSLPETSLLVLLSRLLDCTVDSLLVPSELQILDAVYTDGNLRHSVTARLGKYVEGGTLDFPVTEKALMHAADSDRLWFLLVKYKNRKGTFCSSAKAGGNLVIGVDTEGWQLPAAGHERRMTIVDAYYGNSEHAYNAMGKIRHYEFFKWDRYRANHETFPSNPMVTGPEYLSLIYINGNGLHLAVCGENESLAITPDGSDLVREPENSGTYSITGIEALGWDKGMDCTWAGALAVALRSMGHLADMSLEDAYVRVMGVSGACYRLAFSGEHWDYSSVDGLVAFDYATPGYGGFGYTPLFADRVEKKDRERERDNIIRSLKQRRPVMAINLRVAPEWGVIAGYGDGGKSLLCRTYFDGEIIEKELGGIDQYLGVDNWPFIITHFGGKGNPVSEEANLRRSLEIFAECVNIPGNRGYSMGYQAYSTWAESLRDRSRFEVDDGTFWRLYSVNHFCMKALTDARRCAWKYLESNAGPYSGRRRELLLEMAGNFRVIFETVQDIYVKLTDLCPSESQKARELWPEELREVQAEAFDRACGLERETEALAREFLRIGQ